ncbi:hypothetical protein [Streptomyces sp. NPDC127072]|uniref:hypothetical protein n=1 Tax=Streptomyces sp. NPDC127072 TaxID=3347129 RepID=UPI0036688172
MPAQASESTPPKNATQWQVPNTKDVDKPTAVPSKGRADLLGSDYKQSTDTAFTTSCDGTGFHFLDRTKAAEDKGPPASQSA